MWLTCCPLSCEHLLSTQQNNKHFTSRKIALLFFERTSLTMQITVDHNSAVFLRKTTSNRVRKVDAHKLTMSSAIRIRLIAYSSCSRARRVRLSKSHLSSQQLSRWIVLYLLNSSNCLFISFTSSLNGLLQSQYLIFASVMPREQCEHTTRQ